MNIEARGQQSLTWANVITVERASSIGDSVTSWKRQAKPQTGAVLSTNQHRPCPIYTEEQRAASSTIESSDML